MWNCKNGYYRIIHSFALNSRFQILLILSLLLSCNSNTDLASPADVLQIAGNDVVGLWRIDRFLDGGIDETPEFAEVNVSFENDGKFLLFRNNSKIYEGVWRIRLDKIELAINLFNALDPYDEWNAKWYVTKKDINTLWLINSGSVGKEEFRLSR